MQEVFESFFYYCLDAGIYELKISTNLHKFTYLEKIDRFFSFRKTLTYHCCRKAPCSVEAYGEENQFSSFLVRVVLKGYRD
ncbi:hypothetical protein SAMN02745219_02815 [Desulfofundulus thermosubterraneus DSM 16057]|uniref:Uncharacterized protein n=1 Tax=Desulfofundulus thermosubterraneus DSM 16057 TaxID=1121432 RepID=A0A1M6K8F0_9FIRM|nr:hypothetical protein SAMN02745219_02815 [Desulfofundulus thermosubterraneus DSM 16057]